MKKIIAVIVVFVVLIAGIAYLSLGSDKIESSNEFGQWGSKIVFRYTDGSLKPLTMANSPLSWFYGDGEIDGLFYSLKAQATGENYGYVDLDFTNYECIFNVRQNDVTFYNYIASPYKFEEGWNIIVFSQEALDNFDDSGVTTVFNNLEPQILWVFEEGTWKNYEYGVGGNTLSVILPDTIYRVKMSDDKDFDKVFRMNVDSNWYNYLYTFIEAKDSLPEDYHQALNGPESGDSDGWTENIIFPQSLWEYSSVMSSLGQPAPVVDFLQSADIFDEVILIFAYDPIQSWSKARYEAGLPQPLEYIEPNGRRYSIQCTESTDIFFAYDLLPDGDYIVTVEPGGSIRYRPEGETWYTATLPEAITFTLIRAKNQHLQISFSQDVGP